ncbi:uncharacterized protein E0L32_005708 [Thyridium curvatum]|uniref:MaoC-like domain-containing protein n=1 Tax=Thyridium curvatum TaxID=1093900 RepID=A0A507B4Y9_9PEZI|nr:uncharacterized protein E0L32_005708 [Thyridium curvatum]TPX13764.1 hypothetical protein E0L32_005708 [Thyridium curvatum]
MKLASTLRPVWSRLHHSTAHPAPPKIQHTRPSSASSQSSSQQGGPSTSPSTPPDADIDIAAVRSEMLSRPRKAIHDVLSPMPSHLLSISLADFLPGPCLPAHFPYAAFASHPPSSSSSSSSSASASASLSNPRLPPLDGSPLPQGHHLVYFPLHLPPSALCPDGTDPAHLPPLPAHTRRMWAGGSVSFAPDRWRDELRLGGGAGGIIRRAVCVEGIGDVSLRGGGDKDKVFVDLWRRYGALPAEIGGGEGGGGVVPEEVLDRIVASPAIEERRTLVFMREDKKKDAAAGEPSSGRVVKETKLNDRDITAPYTPTSTLELLPSQTLLFHFSALSYNAHGIHLDTQYARDVEGHRGLLVQGPLTLVLMFSALRRELGGREAVREIEYRNLAPLYCGEKMRVCVRPNDKKGAAAGDGAQKWDVWIEGPDGGLAVKGVATSEPGV